MGGLGGIGSGGGTSESGGGKDKTGNGLGGSGAEESGRSTGGLGIGGSTTESGTSEGGKSATGADKTREFTMAETTWQTESTWGKGGLKEELEASQEALKAAICERDEAQDEVLRRNEALQQVQEELAVVKAERDELKAEQPASNQESLLLQKVLQAVRALVAASERNEASGMERFEQLEVASQRREGANAERFKQMQQQLDKSQRGFMQKLLDALPQSASPSSLSTMDPSLLEITRTLDGVATKHVQLTSQQARDMKAAVQELNALAAAWEQACRDAERWKAFWFYGFVAIVLLALPFVLCSLVVWLVARCAKEYAADVYASLRVHLAGSLQDIALKWQQHCQAASWKSWLWYGVPAVVLQRIAQSLALPGPSAEVSLCPSQPQKVWFFVAGKPFIGGDANPWPGCVEQYCNRILASHAGATDVALQSSTPSPAPTRDATPAATIGSPPSHRVPMPHFLLAAQISLPQLPSGTDANQEARSSPDRALPSVLERRHRASEAGPGSTFYNEPEPMRADSGWRLQEDVEAGPR